MTVNNNISKHDSLSPMLIGNITEKDTVTIRDTGDISKGQE
jgi:hypothetical protein